MDTNWLSQKVWQMASFLRDKKQSVQIPLIYIRNIHDQAKQPSNFKLVSLLYHSQIIIRNNLYHLDFGKGSRGSQSAVFSCERYLQDIQTPSSSLSVIHNRSI